MTKTDYREYINSPEWQERRKEFLLRYTECERCGIPRWLAEIAYDQDLNVHHISYANLGDENWADLEALCRRCHEIEKFGRSDLREPKSTFCELCSTKHWNCYSNLCGFCCVATTEKLMILHYVFDNKLDSFPRLTVSSYLTMLLMIHYEGADGLLAVMGELEPITISAREETKKPHSADNVPF